MKFSRYLLVLFVLLVGSACSETPVVLETPIFSGTPQESVGSTEQVDQPTIDLFQETSEIDPPQTTSKPVSDPDTTSQFPKMLFGMESHHMPFDEFPNFVGESGMKLVRHNGLIWPQVEPIEGQRDWQAVADLEEKLAKASASGLSTILIVRGTPEWAQLIPGSACGPIKPDKMESFAIFMAEAVSRYSVPPYNVKYWELGNEPDVDPSLIPQNSPFGCWGDMNDVYYGGGYYAQMLKTVYPAIKEADPEANGLIGGLLLDCDPTHVPEGKDCTPGKFLEGILVNGGGEYFDAVSFHGYAPYFGPESGLPTKLFFDDHHPSWEHRGGVVVGKVDFLREVLETYNHEKPIFHTEGALICPEQNPTDCESPEKDFFDMQADYAIRMYVRNWANEVAGTIWYQFEGPGWRYSGLLDENQNPKPVYQGIDFLTTHLSNAQYVGVIDMFDSIEGYEFASPESRTWILWSPDEIDTLIIIPKNTSKILDKFGNELSPEGNQIVVNSPTYIVLSR